MASWLARVRGRDVFIGLALSYARHSYLGLYVSRSLTGILCTRLLNLLRKHLHATRQ